MLGGVTMNEKGNITISVLIVFISVTVVSILTWLLIASAGVVNKSEVTVLGMYERDTPLEVVKYVAVNELLTIAHPFFDETTSVYTKHDILQLEKEINKALIDINNEYVVSLEMKGTTLVEDICDNIFSTEGVRSVYCEYIPFNVILELEIKKDGKSEGLFTLKLSDLHLQVDTEEVQIDSTKLQIKIS